jgi:hypothetical protein
MLDILTFITFMNSWTHLVEGIRWIIVSDALKPVRLGPICTVSIRIWWFFLSISTTTQTLEVEQQHMHYTKSNCTVFLYSVLLGSLYFSNAPRRFHPRWSLSQWSAGSKEQQRAVGQYAMLVLIACFDWSTHGWLIEHVQCALDHARLESARDLQLNPLRSRAFLWHQTHLTRPCQVSPPFDGVSNKSTTIGTDMNTSRALCFPFDLFLPLILSTRPCGFYIW